MGESDDVLLVFAAASLAASHIRSRALAVARLAQLREDSDVLVALRVLVSNAEELPHYARAFHGEHVSASNERRWRVMLRTQVSALMREWQEASTAEEDRTVLAERAPPGGTSARQTSAILTRMGEKVQLARILDELEQHGTPDPVTGVLARRAAEAIDRAPAASRAVLALHYLEELTLPEVASVLGVPVGTAKSRLAYGLRFLRRIIDPVPSARDE